jgi:hypothetical protein
MGLAFSTFLIMAVTIAADQCRLGMDWMKR